ncbi:MAG TPA: sugar phosphate isomerase/epimerase [Clostridiales bacterium]|jgi:sugar phosphate isomerase/epimerase|nr:sugar phosphate isomerase/epimerase [Clostridiales bacterium]
MLLVGVQSARLFTDDVDRNFRVLKEHGFGCVDFNIDIMLPGSQIRKGEIGGFFDRGVEELCEYYRPMKEAAEKYNIEISQMHGPFPVWVEGRDADMNPYVLMATEKCFAVAEYLGCRNIVVHPVFARDLLGKEGERELNLNIYRSLMPAAQKYGVKICLENLFVNTMGHCIEGPCADVSEAIWYIDRLNAEAGADIFGFCFDTGHANLMARNMYDYISALGPRLAVLHIHDNDGKNDLHMLPYSYTRNGRDPLIDWEGIIKGLRDIKYRGDLCFETFHCMSIFPPDVHNELLNLISAIGRHMVAGILA